MAIELTENVVFIESRVTDPDVMEGSGYVFGKGSDSDPVGEKNQNIIILTMVTFITVKDEAD